ncbi:DNA mismatch repair endonuclease MutL [Conservatibacter flavescens]|uniref:DNA mismatch repair protein MutL n=1 Tax=Conservatibacter flavescens TaxID=28161 RepID=A0A2M8S1Y4_9PAST|nr:DNA mismatch repair endonuclease MutL [Conservatibacter flavescens]PJG85171.1 DNA mismatch repair endonuclease MutL [Conservatibacter flavescens]
MAIQILPPQLANQIAAGEVVERPASVVKELVENSLDAGATRIQIDIEQGGASLIRVRDNGFGIPKTELALALARHATSKILCLEDLEAILSLGFRGEALASISSVSRFTLTSRTAEQSEAWQVYAQGRDMETTIQPASHPVGTTVEVANLFFNTPARRKFLRTDKTEFAHIDEVIRRIALAKPHVTFSLSHNNKLIRQYKNANNAEQQLKRIAAICGNDFIQNALHIDWKHEELYLSGWVALPQFTRPQNDLAYSYVNGRMVRDKVITHAIRQAYNEYLHTEQYPAFVLFLELNPNDVDVNVHPTKHEVRFHQSRLIHDFIYQGIVNALQTDDLPLEPSHSSSRQIAEPAPEWHISPVDSNRAAAGKNIFTSSSYSSNSSSSRKFEPRFSTHKPYIPQHAQTAYGELLKTEDSAPPTCAVESSTTTKSAVDFSSDFTEHQHLRALSLIANKALLLQQSQQLYLLPIKPLQQLKLQLTLQQDTIAQQALLIPLAIRLDPQQQTYWQQQKHYFAQIGFQFHENLAQQRITLNNVPICLRQQNIQKCIVSLLAQSYENLSSFLTALYEQIIFDPIEVYAEAVSLLNEVEQLIKTERAQLNTLLIPIDLSAYLSE